jgi:hypothetical protein
VENRVAGNGLELNAMAAIHARLRQLKEDFDAAHQRGMYSLAAHDYDALNAAILQERAIIEEQSHLLAKLREVDAERRQRFNLQLLRNRFAGGYRYSHGR